MRTKNVKMVYLLYVVILSCLVSVNIGRAQNPVGWWKLDDGSGKVALDSSGNGNNGTIEGNNAWVNGKIDGAMRFNGFDTYISVPHIPLSNSSFTIAMWIRPIMMFRNHTFFSLGEAADNKLMHIRLGGTNSEYDTPVGGIRFAFYNNDLDTSANIIQVNKWYHLAFVYDYENKIRTIYIDGVENIQDTEVPPFIGSRGDTILGATTEIGGEYFSGILDDVRIYDVALTNSELRAVISFGVDVQYKSMSNALEEVDKLIQEQKYKQAIPLLEKEISKYEQFKEANQNKDIRLHELLACELNYLQGVAYEANGDSKNNIAEAYQKALMSDSITDKNFTMKQGTALYWLFQNMNSDYNNVIESILKNDVKYIKAVTAKSEEMVSNRQVTAAIKFLEGNIDSYTQWQKEHPFDEVIAEDMLPEIYFQLAKAKESIKAPAKDIIEAYSNTFNFSSYDYVPQRTAAFIWLSENNRTEELTQIIKSFTQEQDIQQSYKDIISGVCKHFESTNSANGAKCFLDTLFSNAKNPSEWAALVESCITNKTNQLAKVYYSSLEGIQELKFGVDCKLAERLVSEEKYKEAADLYKDILTRCGPDDNKSEIHFSLLKCLFESDFYSEVNANVDSFISNNYKGTIRSRVKEALLMKGRALIQLAEVDKAIDVFSSVMIEYPETGELPETTFFIGYCYMLQAKFKEATEAFEIVLKNYPDSTYADQAKELLVRIKDMSVDNDEEQ